MKKQTLLFLTMLTFSLSIAGCGQAGTNSQPVIQIGEESDLSATSESTQSEDVKNEREQDDQEQKDNDQIKEASQETETVQYDCSLLLQEVVLADGGPVIHIPEDFILQTQSQDNEQVYQNKNTGAAIKISTISDISDISEYKKQLKDSENVEAELKEFNSVPVLYYTKGNAENYILDADGTLKQCSFIANDETYQFTFLNIIQNIQATKNTLDIQQAFDEGQKLTQQLAEEDTVVLNKQDQSDKVSFERGHYFVCDGLWCNDLVLQRQPNDAYMQDVSDGTKTDLYTLFISVQNLTSEERKFDPTLFILETDKGQLIDPCAVMREQNIMLTVMADNIACHTATILNPKDLSADSQVAVYYDGVHVGDLTVSTIEE